MSATRIAGRYAKSLIDLAQEQGKLEEIHNDMLRFREVSKVKDFTNMLKSPIINADIKQRSLDAIFGGKVSEMTNSFFKIILRKGREAFLPEIADSFIQQYRSKKRISSVTLVTASPVSDSMMASIKTKLIESNVTHANLDIKKEVDPSLIGGFVIKMGDTLYDASVARKLADFKKELTNN